MSKFAMCYVFAWYGPRSKIKSNPAVREQLRRFKHELRGKTGLGPNELEIQYRSDYARRVESLESLPNLKAWLENARKRGPGTVIFVDDLRRLFLRCPLEDRPALLDELQTYGANIIDLAFGKELKAFLRTEQMMLVSCGRPKVRAAPKPNRAGASSKNTQAANLQSAKARSARAQALANRLSELRRELLESGRKVTLAALADEANERGLKTARGGNWSAATVKRMLDRIQDLETEN